VSDRSAPPRDLPSLRAMIVDRQERLPKRLLQAGQFALAHPQDMAFGTIAEVAQSASVQPSTLVRFAQALGYAGFSDLQAVFRAHARDRWPDYRERLDGLRSDPLESGPSGLLAGFARASMTSIGRLQDTLDPAALQQAVEVLAQADTLYLLGARRAFPVVTYLAYALRKLGVNCQMVDHVGGLAADQVELIRPHDAVLAISFTPYTPTTLELAAHSARRGIPLVAITDTPFSPLVQGAQVWLEVVEADHAGFRSLAATFALAMALAVGVAERRT
jgi:DNA-binding MurR/RpiR family transcriptional regulator